MVSPLVYQKVTKGPAIFWEGADDDASRMKGVNYSRTSLLAYILLAENLVIHPAYVFQESATRELLVGSELANAASRLSLTLGEGENAASYIRRRVDMLAEFSKDWHTPSAELEQYQAHGDQLAELSAILDSRFPSPSGHFRIVFSRDAVFRTLIRDELINQGTLKKLIVYAGGRSKRVGERAVVDVLSIIEDPHAFVNIDSILIMLRRSGIEAKSLQRIRDRLHLLHWKCQASSGLRTPLATRETEGTVDPYDPEIFWAAMEPLVGSKWIQKLWSLSWGDACKVAKTIRTDGTWKQFRRAYIDIVEEISSATRGLDSRKLHAALKEKYPTRFKTIVRGASKVNVVGALISLVTLSIPMGLFAWIGVIGTGLGTGDVLLQGYKDFCKYDESIRHDLASRIRSAIRSVGFEDNLGDQGVLF